MERNQAKKKNGGPGNRHGQQKLFPFLFVGCLALTFAVSAPVSVQISDHQCLLVHTPIGGQGGYADLNVYHHTADHSHMHFFWCNAEVSP